MTTDLARLATAALADDRVATPGPWVVQADTKIHRPDGHRVYGITGPKLAAYDDEPEQEWREVQIVETDGGHYPPKWKDAAFIAAARTREPLLAAGVLDLTRQLAEARAALVEACRVLELRADPLWPDYDEEIARIVELKAKGGV